MRILVSACLLGVACRYDGKALALRELLASLDEQDYLPICPEQLGGLPTPREPAEIGPDGRVRTRSGQDVTEAFRKGAEESLKLAERFGCRLALLKERSPSCGSLEVCDGSFSGRLVAGQGLTAAALRAKGILVIGESELRRLPLLLRQLAESAADSASASPQNLLE